MADYGMSAPIWRVCGEVRSLRGVVADIGEFTTETRRGLRAATHRENAETPEARRPCALATLR